MAPSDEADQLISALGLSPHPEGGFYRETFRDSAAGTGGRAVSTAILFLLRSGEVSVWHRVDAAEVWHYYRGASLELTTWSGHGPPTAVRLGPAIEIGETPQSVVPAGVWQMARSLGSYTLVGCTVAPGFQFSGFELPGPEFNPSRS